MFQFRLALPQFNRAGASPGQLVKVSRASALELPWLDITMGRPLLWSVWQSFPQLHGAVTHGAQAESTRSSKLVQQQQCRAP